MNFTKDQYLLDVWNKVLDYMHTNQNVDSEIINNFYKPCSLHQLTTDKAILVAPNIISKQILQSQSDVIVPCFIDVLHLDHTIILEVYQEHELPDEKSILTPVPSYNDIDFQSMPIQKDRTFDNFIVGDCNKESQAAALACALNPGKFFNPLFIYGNSGLGKTHLLMSIANYVLKKDRKSVV